MKKEQREILKEDWTKGFLQIVQQTIDFAQQLNTQFWGKSDYGVPDSWREINPVVAMNELRGLIQPFDWAWAAIRSQETPGEMERVFRNMFIDCWATFAYKSERVAVNQYDPERQRTAAAFAFIEHYLACFNMVNWTMFFDRIKGIKTYYTTTEVTQILGMTRPTINKYMKEGRLQAAKFGRDWRFPAESIDQFLQKTWQKGRGKK